jgi:hypothetical protein
MGRYGVTKEDVFNACRSLAERTVPLTQENVRNELKTGSYTTVWRHLKDYKKLEEEKKPGEAKPETYPIPESLTSDAIQLVQSLWNKAWTLAQTEIHALRVERDELKLALDDKSSEFDSLFSETQKLEDDLETVQKEVGQVRETALKSLGEMQTLKTQLSAREQETKTLLERALSAEQIMENMRAKSGDYERELRTLLERAISAEKELSFLKTK